MSLKSYSVSQVFTYQEQMELKVNMKTENRVGIADFELIKVIGRGAFGKVYLV